MNKSKVAIVVNNLIQKIEAIVGWGWTAIFVIALFSEKLSEMKSFDVFVYLICIGSGIALIVASHKRKKLAKTFMKYVEVLSADPTGLFENIAATTGTSVDVVKKNLKLMIEKKFFANAYLDETGNRIVLHTMTAKVSNDNYSAPSGNESGVQYISCKCPSCGGANKVIKGVPCECDFCGSPING